MKQHALLLYARAYYTCTYPCTHTLHMRARASAQECACTAHDAIERARTAHAQHMTQSSAHAQTRMHPGTCGPTTHAHTHPCINTRACLRTHMRYARTQAHVCTHPHNAYAYIRTRTREHACTCARTRANTRPHIWLRANRLGPYSSAVSCV